MPTKFISFDRLSRYTQKLKSYVGSQIQSAKTEWQNQLKLKVDKVTGKGLSTNDFTNEYKSKLDGIESGAQKNTVTGIKGNSESAYRTGNVNLTPANIGALEPSGDASNTKVSFTQSSGRANLTSGETLKTSFGKLSKWYADLKAVAFSGSYNDLSNKPTAFKNPQSLTIQQNGGSQTEYDGSTKLTVNITKAGIGLGNVENKSSATIRGELTSSNVTTALGFTPARENAVQLTDEDLNNIVGYYHEGKTYFAMGENTVQNVPVFSNGGKINNFWMLVIRTGSSAYSQILKGRDNNTHDSIFHRYTPGDSTAWTEWKRIANIDDIPTALKNPNALTIQLNGASQGAYDGSAAKTINVTKASIGLGNVENLSAYGILNKIEAIHVNKGLGYSAACYIRISLPISPSGSFTAKSSVRFGRKVSYEYYRSAGAMPVPSWPTGKLKEHFQIVSFYPQDSSMSMNEFNKIVSIDISSVEDMGDGFMDFVVYLEEKPSTSFYVTLNIMYSNITAS